MNELPHALSFEACYRTATREGRYHCATCGHRVLGVFDSSSELLTITLAHVRECKDTSVVGVVTINGERRAAVVLSNPARMIIASTRGAIFDRATVRALAPN